jgi:hypothetical protein
VSEYRPLNASGLVRPRTPPPDGPSPLGWRGDSSCAFCESPDTEWQHDLNASLANFQTVYGKGCVWGGAPAICESCEQLYNGGEYVQLARLKAGGAEEFLADELASIAAFCRADRGPRALAAPDFPAGFEPLDQFTGAEWVIELWPAQHQTSIPETRWPQIDNDAEARLVLVRSPWQSVSLNDVFRALWSWVQRIEDGRRESSMDALGARARVSEVFGWSDAQARQWLDTLPER